MNQPYFTKLDAPRICLRRFCDRDLPAFVGYRNDPEVARYQSWTSVNEYEARIFIDEMKLARPGVPGEWFQFAIEHKSSGQLIGDCAMQIKAEDGRQAEIGYTLARAYHRQGYGYEAISTLLTYAFRSLNLHRVIAMADCRNVASVALLKKLGMRCEGHFIQNFWFKGEWADEYLYAILQDEWRARVIG
jgi:aminoglycoside 6'-N-acetyltransferase